MFRRLGRPQDARLVLEGWSQTNQSALRWRNLIMRAEALEFF